MTTQTLSLDPGESIVLKFKDANGLQIDLLHVKTPTGRQAKIKVVAVCDDGVND